MTFANRHGREIGDHPQDFKPCGDDDDFVVEHLTCEFPGVVPAPEDDAALPGVDTDFDAEPTGVDVDSDYVPQEVAEVNGIRQQDTNAAPTKEPSSEPTLHPQLQT